MPEFTPPAVVVGVDGSRDGLRAAVWAVDEAIGRDLPLRLITIASDDSATTPRVLHDAVEAVRATGRNVTMQTAVVSGTPTTALVAASTSAVMVCVGAVGLKHFDRSHTGSTAGALAASAHCPVAIVRGDVPKPGWVVTELDGTPDSATVLQFAVEESRLRGAPLRVVGTWQSDAHVTAGDAEHVVRAQLDRRLEQWKHRYPDLDVAPVAVQGSGIGYLTQNSAAIQMVVVGVRNTAAVNELLGPRHINCPVLVVDAQRLL